MKIDQINSTAATAAVNGDRKANTAGTDKKTSATGVAQTDASTHVELSPAASLLSAASADPTFDSAKVERIAQAIKDGKFTVNHGAIADKLISNAQELLTKVQP